MGLWIRKIVYAIIFLVSKLDAQVDTCLKVPYNFANDVYKEFVETTGRAQISIKENQLNGDFIAFYPQSEKVRVNGVFESNNPNGLWKWYYKNGKLTSLGYYRGDAFKHTEHVLQSLASWMSVEMMSVNGIEGNVLNGFRRGMELESVKESGRIGRWFFMDFSGELSYVKDYDNYKGRKYILNELFFDPMYDRYQSSLPILKGSVFLLDIIKFEKDSILTSTSVSYLRRLLIENPEIIIQFRATSYYTAEEINKLRSRLISEGVDPFQLNVQMEKILDYTTYSTDSLYQRLTSELNSKIEVKVIDLIYEFNSK